MQEANEPETPEEAAFRKETQRRDGDLKQWALLFRIYCFKHNDRYPDAWEQVTDQLGPETPASFLESATNTFEIVYHGDESGLSNRLDTILFRERQARRSPSGDWVKVRQRLDAFKRAAPDNALADYLSAQARFSSGQAGRAVDELLSGSSKATWQDYSADLVQNAEEAYLAAGYSEAAVKAAAGNRTQLPEAIELAQLGKSLAELAEAYRQAGDEASAQATLQLGLDLGRRLQQPSACGCLVEHLDGIFIEKRMLSALDPAAPYDRTGLTIKDRLGQLDRRTEELVGLRDPPGDQPGRSVLQALSEPDLIGFFDRVKASGEIEALRWAPGEAGRSRSPSLTGYGLWPGLLDEGGRRCLTRSAGAHVLLGSGELWVNARPS